MARAQRGDLGAFQSLVEEHSHAVFRLAFRLTGNEQDAEDVVQETSSQELEEQILHSLFLAEGADRLGQVARDAAQSDELRRQAVHNLGLCGGAVSRKLLLEIYGEEAGKKIREEVLHSLFLQEATSELIAIVRRETDPELKKTAVHWLGLIGCPEATELLLENLEQ